MKIDDPITLARSCRTAHQAARAMAALEAEISLADRRSEDWYLEADCAIDYLRQRFPDARQLDVYTQAPSLSPGARRVLRNGRADTAGGRSSSTTLPGLSVAVRRHP